MLPNLAAHGCLQLCFAPSKRGACCSSKENTEPEFNASEELPGYRADKATRLGTVRSTAAQPGRGALEVGSPGHRTGGRDRSPPALQLWRLALPAIGRESRPPEMDGKISAKRCSFSAVSSPIFASKYAFDSIFQNLPDSQAEFFEI